MTLIGQMYVLLGDGLLQRLESFSHSYMTSVDQTSVFQFQNVQIQLLDVFCFSYYLFFVLMEKAILQDLCFECTNIALNCVTSKLAPLLLSNNYFWQSEAYSTAAHWPSNLFLFVIQYLIHTSLLSLAGFLIYFSRPFIKSYKDQYKQWLLLQLFSWPFAQLFFA